MLELLSLLKAGAEVPDLVTDIANLIESCHSAARNPTPQELAAIARRLQAHLKQFDQDASAAPAAADLPAD